MDISKETLLHKILVTNKVNSVLELIEEKTLPFKTLMGYYSCAMMEIETKFNVLNKEFSIAYDKNPISSITTRLKKPESIIEKMARKKLPFSVENMEKNINDIAGVRVICNFPEDVYELRDALLKQDDVTLIQEKDYIKNPKENGYRSLHLIVEVPIFLKNEKRYMKVEIQIRTIAMDFWASLEHQLRYKKNVKETSDISKELLECAKISSELDYKMEKIRKMMNE